MIELRWTESMGVGVDQLDDDHRGLIETMRRMQRQIRQRDAVVPATVDALSAAMLEHFMREERMLASCGYPELAYHARGHHAAAQRLEALRESLGQGDWAAAEIAAEEFAAFFLFRMIIDDMDYKWYLIDRQLEPRFAGSRVAQWLPRQTLLMSEAGFTPV